MYSVCFATSHSHPPHARNERKQQCSGVAENDGLAEVVAAMRLVDLARDYTSATYSLVAR